MPLGNKVIHKQHCVGIAFTETLYSTAQTSSKLNGQFQNHCPGHLQRALSPSSEASTTKASSFSLVPELLHPPIVLIPLIQSTDQVSADGSDLPLSLKPGGFQTPCTEETLFRRFLTVRHRRRVDKPPKWPGTVCLSSCLNY
jgi:hypothetical protein